MDSEGYPEEKELRAIRKWDVKDFPSLLEFIEQRWTYRDFIKRYVVKERDNFYLEWTLITGGWSGNESLVNALLSNTLFEMCWYWEWSRGGRHVFRIDPRNVGFRLVSEYCKENKVSRQYVSQAKDKFEYFKLSPNKVFIRKKHDNEATPKINRNGNPTRSNSKGWDGLLVFDSDVERAEKKMKKKEEHIGE